MNIHVTKILGIFALILIIAGCKDDPSNQYFNSNAENNGKCMGVISAKVKLGQDVTSAQSQFAAAVTDRIDKDMTKIRSCLTSEGFGANQENASAEDGAKCAFKVLNKADADFIVSSVKIFALILESQDPQWALETNHRLYCAPMGL